MPFPFRTPATEEWTPPDYAVPVATQRSEGEEWTPPSYATPVGKKKEGPSAFSRVISALKPAEQIKATGSLLPASMKPSTEPISYDESLKRPEAKGFFSTVLSALRSTGAGENARRSREGEKDKKPEDKGFLSSVTNALRNALRGEESERKDTSVVGVDQKKLDEIISKLPESMRQPPIRYRDYPKPGDRIPTGEEDPARFFGSLAAPAAEVLTDPLNIAAMGARIGIKAPKGGEPPIRRSREIPYRMEAPIEAPKPTEPIRPANKLKDFMKKNPEATMADIEEFTKSVAGAKVKPPEISTVAPTQTPEELKPKPPIGRVAQIQKEKQIPFSEAKRLADEEAAAKPTEAAVEEKKPFVSPFEKKAEKPLEQTFGEFGGVGHPDEPGYTDKVLKRAGSGEPGLAVEPVEGLDNVNHVVYRNKDGEPIAAAMVVKDQSGKTLVQDLAADKSKGLLTGRAMKALGGKLEELGATESSGTMSVDAQNFIAKMKERTKGLPSSEVAPLNLSPEEYSKIPPRERSMNEVRADLPPNEDVAELLREEEAWVKKGRSLESFSPSELEGVRGGKFGKLKSPKAIEPEIVEPGKGMKTMDEFIEEGHKVPDFNQRAKNGSVWIDNLYGKGAGGYGSEKEIAFINDTNRMKRNSGQIVPDEFRAPETEWKPPEYAKPVEINASGESAASQEAINRQASMKAKGEQYVVYDRAGNVKPLIGPEAVDYVPRPGETFGIITPTRGFRVLESRGGKIPSMFTKLSSERGSMTIGEGMPAFSEGPRGETGRTLIRNTQSEVRSLLRATLPEDLEKFNSYVAEGSANADYAKAVVPMKIKDLADTLRNRAEWGLKNFPHDNVPGQRAELEQTSRYLHKLADRLEKGGDAETLYKVKNELLQDVDKPSMFRRLSSETGSMNISGGTPGGGEPFEGPQGRVLNKLFNALEDAKSKIGEQADINRVERARRFAASASVKEEGAAGAAKSLSKLRGEFEKVNPGERLQLDQKDTDSLFTAIKKANITEPEKDRGYAALFKLLTGEKTPVRSDLQVLNDVFGNGFADKVIEMHGGLGMVGLKVSKLASTMKSMQNAFSLAPPVRHGLGLMGQKSFYPAARDYFKFYANKEFYNASMKAIEEHPDYLWARDAGLYISKPGSVMGAEEEFLNSYIGNVPKFTGIPMAVGASQRSYSGFLNKARFDTLQSWKKMAEGLGHKMTTVADYVDTSNRDAVTALKRLARKAGISEADNTIDNPEFIKFAKEHGMTKQVTSATPEAKKLANFINVVTGRGDLGSLNKLTNELNTVMWSPRMVASRIQMLNPKLYMDLPKGMRLEGLKSLFSVAALGASVTALTAAAGAKVSNNILSTDFMKSRFGKHVIDPWGGFQQYIVAATRFLAGKTDSPLPTSRLDIAGRFLKNKESPIASLIHTILTAKPGSQGKEGPGTFTTQYGQPTSIQREVAQSFEPIFIQDIQKLMQSEPDWSEDVGLTAAMAGASLTGMAQEYPEKQKGKLGFRKMKLKP